MKRSALLATAGLLLAGAANAQTAMTVFKDPNCGCCAAWAEHMTEAGFEVTIREIDNDALRALKVAAGIPEDAYACHTAMIGDFIVEGHVPAEAITAALEVRPDADGIAVPGMPMGAPGMGGMTADTAFDVVLLDDGEIGETVARYSGN